jgi:hypothetical protein
MIAHCLKCGSDQEHIAIIIPHTELQMILDQLNMDKAECKTQGDIESLERMNYGHITPAPHASDLSSA